MNNTAYNVWVHQQLEPELEFKNYGRREKRSKYPDYKPTKEDIEKNLEYERIKRMTYEEYQRWDEEQNRIQDAYLARHGAG